MTTRRIFALTAFLCFSQLGRAATPAPAASSPGKPYSVSVKDFGAIGDGKTKDTAAFQKALDTVALSGGGEVVVPAGNYLIGSIQMGNRTLLRFEARESILTGSGDAADYPSMQVRWEGRWQPGRRALIYTANVDHSGIIGPGQIIGNPQMAAPQNPRGSVVLEPISCNDLRWEDFSVQQGGNWATHPTYCNDVVIKNVTIRGNRDGIDVDSCRNVRIAGCTITSGDDSISIKSGRGLLAARDGKATEDVLITGCTLTGTGFACIGIGSEISGGVKNLRIEHCKMTARTDAIYLKTRIGRAGVTDGISVDDCDILGGGLLKINLTTGGNQNTADDPVEGPLGYPSAKNLHFSNIRLNNATHIAECVLVAAEKPVENISFTNITGTAANGISMLHAKDVAIKDVKVTVASGKPLLTGDVSGTGLDGAAQYTPPAAAAGRTGPARGPGAFPGAAGRAAPPPVPAQLPANP